MFIRSSTAINDCLIALDTISTITKDMFKRIIIERNNGFEAISWGYESKDERDKAFDELCAFLNSNYKLRDFT